jgi:hypothetical protein
MRFLHALRELLQTWQGAALSILAILGTIYYGPRKMLETYDWYMDRFWDYKVRDFLRSQVIPHRITSYGELAPKPYHNQSRKSPQPLADQRSVSSVH